MLKGVDVCLFVARLFVIVSVSPAGLLSLYNLGVNMASPGSGVFI